MTDDPVARIAQNSQRIVDAFRHIQSHAECVFDENEPTIPVEVGYWQAHQRLYRMIYEIIEKENRPCVACRKSAAHPMSEFNFCMKCHFDLRDEVLP